MSPVLEKVLYIAACLIVPVVWGIVVNWLFNQWRKSKRHQSQDEPFSPDFQI